MHVIDLIMNNACFLFDILFDLIIFNDHFITWFSSKTKDFSIMMYGGLLQSLILPKPHFCMLTFTRLCIWVQCPHLENPSTTDGWNQVPALLFYHYLLHSVVELSFAFSCTSQYGRKDHILLEGPLLSNTILKWLYVL